MFKLSIAFVTLVLFQSVFAAPVLLTAANNNNAAAGVANRRDGPGRINGISTVLNRRENELLGNLIGHAVSPRQDTGDVLNSITHGSPSVENPGGLDSGAAAALDQLLADGNPKRRQLLPGGSDSAGVGSILSDPLGLLGSVLGAAGQADTLGADTTQRKRAARSVAGGFLDYILEAFTGAAKGSDSESAQRRQLGPGSGVDSTDALGGVLDSLLGDLAGREFPPVSTDVESLSLLPGGKRGLETLENPDLGGVDGVPASPLTGDDSGDDDDDNDDGDNDDGDNDDGDNDDGDNDDGDNDDGDNDDGDNDDGDNDDGDNDDGDNDDGDNDDGDNDDGDNDDGDNDDGDNDDGDNSDDDDDDNGNSDGLASTISNALGGAGLDDVTDGATHPLDPRSSESRRPRPPVEVSGSL